MSREITRHFHHHVISEPGDATRYDFRVLRVYDGYRVTALNGISFDHEFASWLLGVLRERAPEVIAASYDGYRDAVVDSQWVNRVIFDAAKDLKVNPWTFLAAAVAAVAVDDQRNNETNDNETKE